jgi:signal transduction histidine kinase
MNKMLKLGTKFALFNLLSKLGFIIVLITIMPYVVTRINILQTDKELIEKREKVIDLISVYGIEPFISEVRDEAFGSYNILKEEFVSLEQENAPEDWNFIEVSQREIEGEVIDYRVLNYSLKVDGEIYLLEIGKSLTSIRYAQQNINRVVLIFLTLVILITLFTDLFFTGKIVYPLSLVIKKLNNSTTPALFDKSEIRTTTSEFLQLDKALINLMIRLDNLLAREKEITANMSHELLTPISVLRSKLENLLTSDISNDVSQQIEESLSTLHRLKILINSLLFFARIESQQFLKEDSFELSDVIKDVLDELQPVAIDKGIIISAESQSAFTFSKANRSLVFSMLYNVLNNSVKYTDPGGLILITNRNDDGHFEMSISDNGKGMTAEQIETLFSRFKKKSVYNSESNGLGLAITKSIADFHKIKLNVDSSPGNGTKFQFLFPDKLSS